MGIRPSHFFTDMKTIYFYLLCFLLCLTLISNAQERFYNLYPGWSVRFTVEENNSYFFAGLDTIFQYDSNTSIFNITDKTGSLTESYRFVSDTIIGFSFYNRESYSYFDDYILASGVIADNSKYVLNPSLCFFNTNNYNLDSIITFRSYFNNQSAKFMFHKSFEDTILIWGDHQTSANYDSKVFFGKYDIHNSSFVYKDYNKPNNCFMTPYQALPTTDGGYLIATEQDMTYMNPERVSACILKIDAAGNEMWRYVIPGEASVPPWGFEACTYRPRIFNAPDGNYWVVWTDPRTITETTLDSNSESTIWIGKLSDNTNFGTLTDIKNLRTEIHNTEINYYLINDSYQAENGDMYVLLQNYWGINSSLVKIHSNGVGAWIVKYSCFPENDINDYTSLCGLTPTSDGGFMLTGEYRSFNGNLFPQGIQSSLAIKTDACGCFDTEGCNDHCADTYAEYFVTMSEASIYPNPASDKINVSFEYSGGETEFEYRIYGLDGKLFQSGTFGKVTDGKVTEALEVTVIGLPSGIYTIQFWGGGKIFTGKFVKE